jgi:DNA repair protein RecO (recombination protein O)
MLISCEAVVLRSRKFGDTSKILNLYTDTNGKLSVISKGARNPKSKLGAALEPLRIIRANIYLKPQRDLHLLSAAEPCESTHSIYNDYDSIISGMMLAESYDQLLDTGESNPALFDLLTTSVRILGSGCENPYSVFTFAQLALAKELGFEISLDCGEPSEPSRSMNNSSKGCLFAFDGGIIAEKKSAPAESSFFLSEGFYAVLSKISEMDFISASRFRFGDKMVDESINFFSRYFSYHFDKNFRYQSAKLCNTMIEM